MFEEISGNIAVFAWIYGMIVFALTGGAIARRIILDRRRYVEDAGRIPRFVPR